MSQKGQKVSVRIGGDMPLPEATDLASDRVVEGRGELKFNSLPTMNVSENPHVPDSQRTSGASTGPATVTRTSANGLTITTNVAVQTPTVETPTQTQARVKSSRERNGFVIDTF